MAMFIENPEKISDIHQHFFAVGPASADNQPFHETFDHGTISFRNLCKVHTGMLAFHGRRHLYSGNSEGMPDIFFCFFPVIIIVGKEGSDSIEESFEKDRHCRLCLFRQEYLRVLPDLHKASKNITGGDVLPYQADHCHQHVLYIYRAFPLVFQRVQDVILQLQLHICILTACKIRQDSISPAFFDPTCSVCL